MFSTQKLFLDDAYRRDFEAEVVTADENGIRLNQTVFYATSGGQPGDTGLLKAANGNIPILTARKGESPDDIILVPAEGAALPAPGTSLTGEIDWELRHRHMRMHTCLHLICSLITGYATGNQIGAQKSRVDFDIPAGAYDKEDLTAQLNALIDADHPVSTRWITDEELAANPGLVRTMSVQPPTGSGKVRLVQIGTDDNMVDLQPCGGTHVRSTGEIGPVSVTKIENKGKQNRRIHIVFADDAA